MKAADVTMKRDESDRKREEATRWGNRRMEEAEERLQEEVRARECAEEEVRALRLQVEALRGELEEERGRGDGGELEELKEMYGALSAEHADLLERVGGEAGKMVGDDAQVSTQRVMEAMREGWRERGGGRERAGRGGSFWGPEGSDVLVKRGGEWLVYRDAVLGSEGEYERAVVEPVVEGALRVVRSQKSIPRRSLAPPRGSVAPDQRSYLGRHESRKSGASRHGGGFGGDTRDLGGVDKENSLNRRGFGANEADADTSGSY